MTRRLTPAPRSSALGAEQSGGTGDAGSADAVAACDHTTAAPSGIPQSRCPRLAAWLLTGALLDRHVAPTLACPACCLPRGLCHCQAGVL